MQYSGVFHGVTCYSDKEGRCRVLNDQFVEVDVIFNAVIGGKGNTGGF
jgi:hypothetical protein